MPAAINFDGNKSSKTPYRAHKNVPSAELWKDWESKGKYSCDKGLLLIMRHGLIVIDIDDEALALEMEAQFPLIATTSIQKTSKGRHYIFKRTPECDTNKLYDKSRCVYNPSNPNEKLDIDIKTKCANGTGGILSIYPSNGKQWLRPMTKYPPIPFPEDFLSFIVTNHID